MNKDQVLLFKVLYVLALVTIGLTLGLLVQHGVDAQVDSLPYYAALWGS